MDKKFQVDFLAENS